MTLDGDGEHLTLPNDRQYLADQQEEDSSRKKVTVWDQLQQTRISCNKQKYVKNVLK